MVARNDDPPLGDTAAEALFEQIYDEFAKYISFIDEDEKEKLSVWIADKVHEAFTLGYAEGCADSKKALEDGYLI